ncbi:helix-turn-helix domain-containing protein [Sorangium sp. So ce726]|uniref:GlxA family transcriptional regulator n=1 Tax=Sorangium sp. So ce726 TaxID=3133319 RepID=UPI003F620D9E
MPHAISVVIFPGFQLLDAAGPIAAFEIAAGFVPGAYVLGLCAVEPGLVRSSSGVAFEAQRLPRLPQVDTLLIAGGDGVREAQRDTRLLSFLRRAGARVPRIASVCSGALLLARAGLLDGKRATTHWCRVAELRREFPNVRVEGDRIWVRDGALWTSAGISAGIDLALAMIAEDLGASVARDVARQLVVYAQRPGGQTQHSGLLELGPAGGRFAELHGWIRQRLGSKLGVSELAARVSMSPRTFARAYVAETGVTPAKAVERLRVEAARSLLDAGALSLQDIADRTGFGDIERMRRAFIRLFGAPPSALRRTGRIPASGPARAPAPSPRRAPPVPLAPIESARALSDSPHPRSNGVVRSR